MPILKGFQKARTRSISPTLIMTISRWSPLNCNHFRVNYAHKRLTMTDQIPLQKEIILNILKLLSVTSCTLWHCFKFTDFRFISHAVRLKSTLLSCQNSSISLRLLSCRFALLLFVATFEVLMKFEIKHRLNEWWISKINVLFWDHDRYRRFLLVFIFVYEWWKWIHLFCLIHIQDLNFVYKSWFQDAVSGLKLVYEKFIPLINPFKP